MSHIHQPDGVLPWWLWLGGYLLCGLLITLVTLFSLRRGKNDESANPKRFALLGIMAAMMILVMTIELPFLPYHFNLSVVVSIVLGPALGLLAAFIVNIFLAFLGHGGITVAGLNALVMAVEMLVGYAVFRGLMRFRTPLAVATFLAVVVGMGFGAASSYSLIVAGAPAINQSLLTGNVHAHEEHAGEEHHDSAVEEASEGGRLNLRILAMLMFGAGSIGWILEGLLSAIIISALYRMLPDILALRKKEADGPVLH